MDRVIVPKGPRVQSQGQGQYRVDQARWSIRGTQPPLPSWVEEIRDHQLSAVDQIAKEYARGAQVVMLDAPTGVGKSLIGELTRREMQVEHGLYVCTTKSLQEQYLRDFPYARVLKGRTNYTPLNLVGGQRDGWRQGERGSGGWGLRITCADCDAGPAGAPAEEQTCSYCSEVGECPYTCARTEALRANVGVLNTSYLLAECNGPGKFRDRELVVMDEADLIEQALLDFVELKLSSRILQVLGLEVPKKGSHMTTIRRWLEEEVKPGLVDLRGRLRDGRTLEQRREFTRIERTLGDVARVIEREDGWVRDGDEEGDRSGNGLVLKPVSIEDVGERFLWRHGEKWLLMSGTTVSAEGQAEVLGLEAAGIEWGLVELPGMFAKENRRVVYAPVGDMTRKGQQEKGGVGKVLVGIERVLARHQDVNVLVHSHTYKLAKEISDHVKSVDSRPVFTYTDAHGREDALRMFKERAGKGGAILVASSMGRGVDLPGDECRVQVIAKVPMASLGSRQVSERMRTPGGQTWYLMETVRSVMQMTGRAVRGTDDWAVTYVLDSHFGKVYADGKRRGMWPDWWVEGLEVGKVREFT